MKSNIKQSLLILVLSLNCLLFSCKPDEKNKDEQNIYNPEISKEEKAKLETSFKICPVEGDKAVIDILKPIREEYKLPAVAAAIVNSDGIIAVGVVGVRKEGTQVPATLNEKWLIASCAKAMTATIAVCFVESGKLKWDTSIGEVFSELTSTLSPEFKKITLIELLSHYSGIQRDLFKFDGIHWPEFEGEGTLSQQRYEVLKDFSKKELLYKPGTKFSYSNVGYIIAAAMLEKVSGKPFEELIIENVFEPLHMDSAGFERGNIPGKITQPWSHYYTGKPTEFTLPDVMAPNGKVYCTISDWAKFITDQLRGAKGKDGLLKASTYKKLQTPPFEGNEALGWMLKDKALYHTGTDTLNQSQVYINVEKGYAVIFCTNIGFDLKNAPENDDDIPVVKAGNTVYKQLGQYYLNTFK